jgi:hypothetical protein
MTQERRALFEANKEAAAHGTFGGASAYLNTSMFRRLLSSRYLVRLQTVSFLGAIDYVISASPLEQEKTQWDHTLGVAVIAVRFAKAARLGDVERDELTAAALLHDVGHGPLSHSLEPYFKEHFGIDHHTVGRDIILGREPFGREIYDILTEHGLDPARITSLIDGSLHGERHNIAFSHPINIDTIEGIYRSGHFIAFDTSTRKMEEVLLAHFSRDKAVFDEFWSDKSVVYERLINGSSGRIADSIAIKYGMEFRLDKTEFFLGEPQFFCNHPVLLQQFTSVRNLTSCLWSRIDQAHGPKGKFWINESAPVGAPERYSRVRRSGKGASENQRSMDWVSVPKCIL